MKQSTRASGFVVPGMMFFMLLAPGVCGAAEPAVSVVVGEEAPELERFAAEELCQYLKQLYGIDTRPVTTIDVGAKNALLVGTPETNPAVAKAIQRDAWPRLSNQGLALLPCKVHESASLVIGGGSPRATLWAVYELVQRWGVRYLLHGDVLPENPGTMQLLREATVMEPEFTVRQWRVVNAFACGPESWGMDDYRPVLDQLAKMKFNRILVSLWTYQPFLHLEVRGVARRSATLWFGFKYPITPDMPGRSLFGEREEFWNPDLPLGAPYEEFRAAGETLIRRLMCHAKRRGMDCVVTASLTDFPAEFKQLPGSWKPVHQLTGQSIVPSADMPPTDPVLTDMASAVLRTTVNTYPDTDFLCLGMPEHRQWVDRYEEAWKALDTRYGIEQVKPLKEVLASAEKRTGYPGGAERAVREVKGDIVILRFYDRLLQERKVLTGSAKPEVPIIYYAVAEELFPILPRILPPGSETLNFVDYTASRILKRRQTLAALGGSLLPATLIHTLHDDNVGILPMLVTGSLHKLNVALRQHDWAGFSTRYWLISDHDPCIAYLARASWDVEATPEAVYADLIGHVCGEPCVADMTEAFKQLEETTVLLEMEFLGISFPTPRMYARYRNAKAWDQVREGYQRALAAVRRARKKTRPAGEKFLDYWIGRLEFGIGYLDCLEAAHRAVNLKASADHPHEKDMAERKRSEAIAEMKQAVAISRTMLETYARVARNRSDAGAIATMAEYVYRPLQAKVKAWTEE